MLLPTKSDWMRSVLGAAAAVAVYTGFLAVHRGMTLPSVFRAHWDELLVVALLVTNGTVCALWILRYRYHRTFQRIAGFLKTYRESPSTFSIQTQLSKREKSQDLRQIAAALDDLCASYRKALSDRVVQNAALESLRSLLGRVDLDSAGTHQPLRGSTTSRDMVARFTPNLYWLTATPVLQQFLGWQMSDLNGRPFADIIHPHDFDMVKSAFETALAQGEVHNIVFRVFRRAPKSGKDGSKSSSKSLARVAQDSTLQRYVQVDMLTRYNDLGVPLHVRCYIIDISDRVRAEKELRRRTQELSETNERLRRINSDLERLKESYRDLYHNAPVMYFSLDAEGLFVTFNDTMLRVLGYSRDDLLKQPYTRLLTADSRQRFLQHPDVYQKPGEVETQWLTKDGAVIDVSIRSAPLQDETGAFVRSRSVAQDVTERNRLASELRRRGDELERANAELRQINDSLDEFTAVVSHDLREPLRTLESYSSFLADEFAARLGEEGANYLSYLVQASRRLSNLIGDLLTLAQAGRITQEPTACDLSEAVATVCQDLDDLIQRRNAVIVVESSLPSVLADKQRINQLLSNLVANGIKYNTNTTPRIVIGESTFTDGSGENGTQENLKRQDSSRVAIYVSDNGIGIDPALHNQIFAIFRRGQHAEPYEGTGAGLAIARKIVEAHGGKIWFTSTPGGGTTFYFTLPRSSPAGPREDTPRIVAQPRKQRTPGLSSLEAAVQPKEKPASNTQQSAEPLTSVNDGLPENQASILLVEDMTEIALITQKLAQRAGYSMHWVTTAEEAWDYLQQNHPDLVLLDIHLPGMNGVDLCKMLRATPQLQDLTIALFSQLEHPEAKIAGRTAGANYVLSKDLITKAGEWQRKLEAILSESRELGPVT